jgi:N utilization substance protein B
LAIVTPDLHDGRHDQRLFFCGDGAGRCHLRRHSAGARRRPLRMSKKDWRHRAREAALQVLYQWDVGKVDVPLAADTFFGPQWVEPAPPSDELRAFAETLASDTVARLEPIDAMIADTAEHWRPERFAVIDRIILRMAVCELLRSPRTPHAVVIDEALELARTFSTEDAVRFINGMLDAIRKKLER